MVIIPDISPLVLNIPIITMLIAFTRYIIGLKSWRNFSPLMLSLALYLFNKTFDNMWVSLVVGLISFVTIIGTASWLKIAIRKITMNYYARLAILYLGGVIGLLIISLPISYLTGKQMLANESTALGLFLMAATLDHLITLQFRKDAQESLRRLLTITILGLVGGLILMWPQWNSFIVRHQEVVLLVLVIDIFIAMWDNLRLTEIIRFNSIIRNK